MGDTAWEVYETDGYYPTTKAYFDTQEEAEKCAEWLRAQERKSNEELDLNEGYDDEYGVVQIKAYTSFDEWLTTTGQGG